MLLNIIKVSYIKMRYPLDELLDKRSIIQLKVERIPDLDTKHRLSREIMDYSQEIGVYIGQQICSEEQTLKWHNDLYEINGKIWDLESDIRKGQLENLSLEDVGKRAISIRELNGKRVGIKSDIVRAIGIGYLDVKVNHASE